MTYLTFNSKAPCRNSTSTNYKDDRSKLSKIWEKQWELLASQTNNLKYR